MLSKKITLLKAAQVPLNGPIRPTGFTTTVDEETFASLEARGLLADEKPAVIDDGPTGKEDTGQAPKPSPDPEAPKGKKFAPLPKKSQGINVWREYAREHDIDVRGLSEKSELMGHIINIVNSQ